MITKDYNGIHLATYAECKKLNGEKWFCPDCGKKTFVCYLDCDGEIINEKVGKCDRADKCNYHYTPKEYFSENGNDRPITKKKPKVYKPEPPISYIDTDIFKKSLKAYRQNNFIQFLNRVFNPHLVDGAIKEYFVGTSKHWSGSTVFWQIDRFGKVRCGKIMLYNPTDGKRVKKPFSHITWVHTVMHLTDYNLKQCLFGEHLLRKYPDRGVAVVESEKTAIIASMWYPDIIFLACGGCQNLSNQRCIPLKERRVVFFPDNGKYEEWREKAKELSHLFKSFVVSDIMEHEAVEQGDDIGDLILANINNKDFSIPSLTLTETPETPENAVEEREEEQRTTEPEEREHAPEHTTNNGIEQSIINQFKAINPSFAHLCERLDLVAVGTETAPPEHQESVANEDTYHFDQSGKFHFNRTPEQEQMMRRDYHTDKCPF